MVEIAIATKGITIVQQETFESIEEAVAYLFGRATSGSLYGTTSISIYYLKEKNKG